MFKINFNIYKYNLNWSAEIHQLNSDILTRHVVLKTQFGLFDLNFDFCEKSNQGSIFSLSGNKIGAFSVF
ncbi:TPA: hypothetical protein I7139_07965 [Vibrio vulnificus]|nr:hypothetical protein [Vibrio vulnificus]